MTNLWQAGLSARARAMASCDHKWSAWKIINYTGDWFHPHVLERECSKCRAVEQEEQ